MKPSTRLSIEAVFLLLFLLPPLWAWSAVNEESPDAIAQRLQKKYDQMTSLSFAFKQQSQGQLSGRPRTGSGTALFYKRGKTSRMRWNYTTPDRQVLISDGTTFSMYFAELQQMIITPADAIDSDLTYTFFSGRGHIDQQFHILPPDQEFSQNDSDPKLPRIIKLVPREPQSQVQSIHLWVDQDSLIRRIAIKDHFDTTTQLNLSDIKVNGLSGTPAEIGRLFTFTPPKGTEIIHQ
ncbi:MAG: LolA family protein [Desulfopila sp.]